jgi:hypothetical protein
MLFTLKSIGVLSKRALEDEDEKSEAGAKRLKTTASVSKDTSAEEMGNPQLCNSVFHSFRRRE